jgi:hypothetical protein
VTESGDFGNPKTGANPCDPLHSLDPSGVLNCKRGIKNYEGINAMTEMTLDQNEEELFTYEVSDEVLEVAGRAEREKANTFTQWICTALYFCPGP